MLRNDYDRAAVAYTKYVLNVRDSFQQCNGKLKNIREYVDGVKKKIGDSDGR